MRILKILLRSAAILGIILALCLFLAREAVLFFSLQRINSSMQIMREVYKNSKYTSQCMSRGSKINDRGQHFRTQLRFVDNSSYLVEVVCNNFELNPIEIDQANLLPLVTKQANYSGIVYDPQAVSGVKLDLAGRTGSIFFDEGMIRLSLKDLDQELDYGPVTNCQGYGFNCCDQDIQQGDGDQITGVLDCPKSCFASCIDRPLVLSFMTQPYYDSVTKTLAIGSGQSVTFAFTVAPDQAEQFEVNPLVDLETQDLKDLSQELKPKQAPELEAKIEKTIDSLILLFTPTKEKAKTVNTTLDFGDGQTQTFTDLQGRATHSYTCNSGSCEYQAKLLLENQDGVRSTPSTNSMITIKVN